MGSFDTITWQALTVILTLGGVVGTVAFWRLRGTTAGLRMLAVTLLPAAAYLTGTLRLIWEIGDAVVSWALRLTFSPAVWLGLALGLTSLVLFALAGALRRRGIGTASRSRERSLPGIATRQPAKAPRASASPETSAATKDDDMTDIEAILKKHGIT